MERVNEQVRVRLVRILHARVQYLSVSNGAIEKGSKAWRIRKANLERVEQPLFGDGMEVFGAPAVVTQPNVMTIRT